MKNILLAESEFGKEAEALLKKHGRVIQYGSHRLFLKNLPAADIIVTGLEEKLLSSVLRSALRLRLIGSRTTQLRYIDLDECKRRGIKVVNIKADSPVLKNTPSTAEETMALIFALARNIPWAFDALKRGKWERRKYGGTEMKGKSLGLIGFGRLGKLVAGYAQSFGVRVSACDPFVPAAEMRRHGVRRLALGALLKSSDIVSVHATYNDSTFGMLKREHFRMMRPHALFINTARGEIIDEKALLLALRGGWLAAAAVDTLAGEKPDGSHLADNPLVHYARNHENLIIVPHLGGATKEATEKTQNYISALVVKEMRKM